MHAHNMYFASYISDIHGYIYILESIHHNIRELDFFSFSLLCNILSDKVAGSELN